MRPDIGTFFAINTEQPAQVAIAECRGYIGTISAISRQIANQLQNTIVST